MATIHLWSWGWWYSAIFLPRKSKLDIAKEFNKISAGWRAKIWQFLGMMTGFKYIAQDPPGYNTGSINKIKSFWPWHQFKL